MQRTDHKKVRRWEQRKKTMFRKDTFDGGRSQVRTKDITLVTERRHLRGESYCKGGRPLLPLGLPSY